MRCCLQPWSFFFFTDTATTEIYTLSLHDALPILLEALERVDDRGLGLRVHRARRQTERSEEHTSELQSRGHLVCRLLLEKKKKPSNRSSSANLFLRPLAIARTSTTSASIDSAHDT